MEINFTPKSADFFCEKCDFKCSKKSDWSRHVKTKKHMYRHNGNKMEILEINFTPKNAENICECGKQYSTISGLWKHKKKCNNVPNTKELVSDKEIITMLVKQNTELMEIIKNGTNNTNSHNTNSNNKTFNLQIFLNETCKDALNISDFVESIKLSLDDLEYTGRKGYIEGITNIVLKNLKNLEEYKRPIHCSDYKREILYIKDNNIWKKENEEKQILTKAIKEIANENIKQIMEWKDLNPDCTDSDSKKNNLYLKIVSNAMSGIDKEESNKNINRIISNLAKEVLINKDN